MKTHPPTQTTTAHPKREAISTRALPRLFIMLGLTLGLAGSANAAGTLTPK